MSDKVSAQRHLPTPTGWTMFKLFRSHSAEYHLFNCARSGNLKLLRKLIASGVVIDRRDRSGRTALCVAAKYGRVEIVRALVEAGADINSRALDGRTPIYFGIHSGSVELVNLMIELGATLDVQDGAGYTPYSYAAARSLTNILASLKPESE